MCRKTRKAGVEEVVDVFMIFKLVFTVENENIIILSGYLNNYYVLTYIYDGIYRTIFI